MKTIKFDLPINGTKVKNLDELRDNLTDEILTLARSSQLERWLRTRQLPEQAQAVATAVRSEGTDKGLFLALCRVLEVEVHPDDVKAIFDAPPAPGRFISGARYFQLYEDLKNSIDKKPVEKTTHGMSKNTFSAKIENLRSPFIGRVAAVHIKNGDYLFKGSLLINLVVMENITSKSVKRVYSTVNGRVSKIFVDIGKQVAIDDELLSIEVTQS